MREDDPDYMRLASSAIGPDDRRARAEVHLGLEPRRALHPQERRGRSGPVPLEQSPHAVITDLGGGGMLGQEVLMNPLGRETVSRWIPRRLAISRQDSPADRSEWIASIIVIFSTFAMTGLLPRLCR